MTQSARQKSWLAYDAKRKGTPARLMKERARKAMRNVPKTGICDECLETKPTVWHHPDYDFPKCAIELCHKCHRSKHPR